MASGVTGADGVFNARFNDPVSDDVITVAACGEETTATDPGSWYLHDPTRELVGYVYTDKPIYRPGHTVHVKAFLRWRSHGALLPFDGKDVELRVSDITDKVIVRQRLAVDAFGAITGDIPLSTGAALGYYSIAVVSGDETASGSFEVQEYRKPEFEVRVTPAERFVVQEGQARVAIDARYTSGSRWPTPASPGLRIVNPTTRRCDGATRSRMIAAGTGGVRIRPCRAPCGSTRTGRPSCWCRLRSTSTPATTRCASKRASPMPAVEK